MQKVISALEHLEKLSSARDSEEQTIESLKTTITHLELEDIKKNEERIRNSKVSTEQLTKSLEITHVFNGLIKSLSLAQSNGKKIKGVILKGRKNFSSFCSGQKTEAAGHAEVE